MPRMWLGIRGKHTTRLLHAAKEEVVRALKQAAGKGDLKDHMLLPADVVNRLLPGITTLPLDRDEPRTWGDEPTQQQKDDEEVVYLALKLARNEKIW